MSVGIFLKHFISDPMATGAIAPSSTYLAEIITDTADLRQARLVIEFGTGSGVFTERVLQKIPMRTTFFGLEINADFVQQTLRRCPTAVVHHDSAVNAKAYMAKLGFDYCDRIVCGLPWAGFPEALQNDLLHTITDILRPGGIFVTFAYLHGLLLPAGLRFRRNLRARFQIVETTPTIWRNLPPAIVYKSVK